MYYLSIIYMLIPSELNSLNLFNNIKGTILKIDKELKEINNTGIYFAPELYISFCIGKDIFQKRQSIFNTTNVKWSREIKLSNGGITDIVFEIEDKQRQTIIEVKIRDDIHSYIRDIEKLKDLKIIGEKFFCVLVDTSPPKNDGRLTELDKYCDTISRIDGFSFPTWNDRYESQIFCNLNLYLVK